jgi:ADP-ribose pyrophosphatase YjhB (NUDIX family)
VRHRIRAAAIIVRGDSVMLVEHKDPSTGEIFWVPPGGGLEGEESIFDCARREVREECGLTIEPGRIVYVREFVEPDRHHFEIFVLAESLEGEPRIGEIQGLPDEHWIQSVAFLSREQIAPLTVYPDCLKDTFWDDLRQGFPTVRYLGLTR